MAGSNATGVSVGAGPMEITVNRAALVKELTACQGVVERKTTIPILSNFLFEATDETLHITATDLDLSLRTSCPAKVKKEGSCTIPARKLYDYVKLLPDADIVAMVRRVGAGCEDMARPRGGDKSGRPGGHCNPPSRERKRAAGLCLRE